jgi:hypothetical protein
VDERSRLIHEVKARRGGDTYSATMVIAEKGSDLIRGKAAPAPVALPA